MEDNLFLRGEFVVWQGQTYRVVSYLEEYELFSLEDIEHEMCIQRIKKEEVTDAYTASAVCDYDGVRYLAYKIKEDRCYFQTIVGCKDNDLISRPLVELNEVWCYKNRKGRLQEVQSLYLNENYKEGKPSDQDFYVEEMASGNLMTAHLEKEKSLEATISDLRALYGGRIEVEVPDLKLLIVDYYIARIKIDGYYFWIDCDFGIITISPEQSNGNQYIREIVTYFNR